MPILLKLLVMLFTREQFAKGLEPFCEEIRLISGDSKEDFEPARQRMIDFYYLCFQIAEEKYYKENPPKPKEPKVIDPQGILAGKVEIPEDPNSRIRGKEIIFMSERFDPVLKNRAAATPLKEKLRFNIKNNIHTKLNFKGVIYADASFMDECVASVLIAAGEEHFNRKVSIVCANKQVKDMLKYVIDGRKEFVLV